MYAWQFAQMNHVARENGWTAFVNMQCQYNLLYREEEREMIPYCEDQGIAVTCFSPLARGWLGGSKHKARADSDVYFNKNYGDALDLKIIELVEAIASDLNATMAEVALAWVCSKPAICSPLISAASLDQLDSNVNALELELSQAQIDSLDELYRPRDVVNDHVPLPLPRHLGGVLPGK